MSYKIKTYPDNTTYVEVDSKEFEFAFKVNSYTDLWTLNQVVDAYNHVGIKPKITIPNLIDAQADRRFGENQSSGLKLVCKFLNNLSADFTVFHPHNSEVVEALMDNVRIMDNTNFIQSILPAVYSPNNSTKNGLGSEMILLSPDAGSYKWIVKLANSIGWGGDVFSASKARDGKTGTLTQFIDKNDFGGRDILVLDDICIYGGTFKGLSKLLRERNCGKVYLAVSHMTIKNLGDDPITNYFDEVFTTNSKFDNYTDKKFNDLPNLHVINLFKYV